MNSRQDENPEQMILMAGAVVALAFWPVALLGTVVWKSPELVAKYKRMFIRIGVVISILGLSAYLLWVGESAPWQLAYFTKDLLLGITTGQIASFVLLGWGVTCGLLMVVAPFILNPKKKGDDRFVRVDDFRSMDDTALLNNLKVARARFLSEGDVPIGFNLKTEEVTVLNQKRRTYHVIALGGTGMGKSNLMMLLILHALYHEQPCVIIDPKGDEEFISELKELAGKLAPLSLRRLKIFRMSKPKESMKYNPLRHGTASQIKDKLLEALNWSEQYYQSISSEFLSEYVSAAVHLGLELNFAMIRRALSDESGILEIIGLLRKRGLSGDAEAKKMEDRLNAFKDKVRKADLLGLAAQLSILDSPELGGLFCFERGGQEIDLREAYTKNQVIYFQLDTLGSGDTSRRLGRVIVEDVKSLVSYIYATIPERDRKFVPLLIDEFGAFATKEFIEELKQARGAKVAAHLFCQGIEDLDVVSREFARQATSNPASIVALRLNDRRTVEEICSAAGTADTFEQSFQVEQGLTGETPTGLGNMRKTKQMIVEHDVLKNLNVGEAVLIERSPSRAVPMRIFKAREIIG